MFIQLRGDTATHQNQILHVQWGFSVLFFTWPWPQLRTAAGFICIFSSVRIKTTPLTFEWTLWFPPLQSGWWLQMPTHHWGAENKCTHIMQRRTVEDNFQSSWNKAGSPCAGIMGQYELSAISLTCLMFVHWLCLSIIIYTTVNKPCLNKRSAPLWGVRGKQKERNPKIQDVRISD